MDCAPNHSRSVFDASQSEQARSRNTNEHIRVVQWLGLACARLVYAGRGTFGHAGVACPASKGKLLFVVLFSLIFIKDYMKWCSLI